MSDDNYIEKSSFVNLIILLNEGKKALFSIILISLLLSIFYSFTATKIYQSKVLIAPATAISSDSGSLNQLSQAVNLSGLSGLSSLSSSEIKTNIALARMESKYFLNDYFTAQGLKPKLFDEDEEPSIYDIERVAKKYLSVSKNKATGLITISVNHSDPEVSYLWTEGIVPFLNNELRKKDIEEGEKNIFYLQEQLGETSVVNIKSVLFNIIEQQAKKVMLANVREDYFFEIVDPASLPEDYVSPNTVQVILVGLFLGTLFGIFYILVKDFIRNFFK